MRNKFEIVSPNHRKHPNATIVLPQRADIGSAGHDITIPIDITIQPNERILVWTDIKVSIERSMYLALHVRSSIGIKKGVILSNLTGIIDSTYYSNPDNDGNIGFSLWNTSDKVVEFKAGERICQGIFSIYGTTIDDKPLNDSRSGGIGSSGKF